MRSWRTALRIARREARRAKGRALLVAAMIAVPVAALAFTAVLYDTFELNPRERADREMGAADAAIRWPLDGPARQDRPESSSTPPGTAHGHRTSRQRPQWRTC